MAAPQRPSIFSRIVAGEIPCHRIFENAALLAFLDINPLADGHTLVVPKREVERLDQLTADESADIGRVLPEIARRIVAATGAAGYNILQNNGAVSGQEIMHVHFHIIPRFAEDGLGFRWQPQKRSTDELAAVAARINNIR